jgi:hypothetical protein
MNVGHWWNDFEMEDRTQEKTCPAVTLSTTYPMWTAVGTNLGHPGEM